MLAPPPETASRAAVEVPPLMGPNRRLWRRTVRRSSSSLLLYRHGRWSLRFFPVQLVVLLHRRYGVHRAEQYFGGDLDASRLGGWTVAGTSAAAGRWGTVTTARAIHALGGTVVVHVTTRRSGRGTVRHPSLGRTFGYLNVHRQRKRKESVNVAAL